MFNDIRMYQAKSNKQEEIEPLMKEVAESYISHPGVMDVKYIKRDRGQDDFRAVK